MRLVTAQASMQHRKIQFPICNSGSRFVPVIRGGGKPRPHSGQKSGRSSTFFSAGETVRDTGIYEVIHDREHRSAHEVVMLSGDAFPACDTCHQQVRFRLVRTAPYIFQDEDFEETK
jgi:hypothetical protein